MDAQVMLAGLVRIDLRDGRVIRLCDGGFLNFGGETYSSEDPVFGSLRSCEPLTEALDNQLPNFLMSLNPADGATIPQLVNPVNQHSRVRLWQADVDADAGVIIGTPTLEFDGLAEHMSMPFGKGERVLEIEVVASGILLLNRREGNSFSSAFHKRVWPGETGEDHRTGLDISVAWGAQSPPRGTVAGGGRGGALKTWFDSL